MTAGLQRPDSGEEKLTENLRCGAVQEHVAQVCAALDLASEAYGIVGTGGVDERHVLAVEAFQFPAERSTDCGLRRWIGQIRLEVLDGACGTLPVDTDHPSVIPRDGLSQRPSDAT